MVPSTCNHLDFKIVGKHFNWLLGVGEQGVGNPKLAVLIETHREDFATLSEEEGVEFSARDLLDWLSIEVLASCVLSIDTGVVSVERFNFGCFAVHVENLAFNRLFVLVLAELIPGVFAYPVHSSVVTTEETVLESQRKLRYFYLG